MNAEPEARSSYAASMCESGAGSNFSRVGESKSTACVSGGAKKECALRRCQMLRTQPTAGTVVWPIDGIRNTELFNGFFNIFGNIQFRTLENEKRIVAIPFGGIQLILPNLREKQWKFANSATFEENLQVSATYYESSKMCVNGADVWKQVW